MKAIVVKYRPVTEKRPARYVARAEGVPRLIVSASETTPKETAESLANLYGWLDDGSKLIGGTLPNRDSVFVLHK